MDISLTARPLTANAPPASSEATVSAPRHAHGSIRTEQRIDRPISTAWGELTLS